MPTTPPDTAQLQLMWNQFWAYFAWWQNQSWHWVCTPGMMIAILAWGEIHLAIRRADTRRIVAEELKKHDRA